jgi:hypothetical protein
MIRNAIKSDINAISSLLKEINALHIQLAPERYKFSTEEVNCAINSYFDQDTKFIFVAEENSQLVGAAFLSIKTEHRDSPLKTLFAPFWILLLWLQAASVMESEGI